MTTIAATLNSQQIAATKSSAGAITESAKAIITDKRFVFFAAFDGTNNDRDAVYKSGSPLDTNVAQLERQISAVWEADPTVSVRSKYYPGPGTGGLADYSAAIPTGKILEIANDAYKDFSDAATAWLRNNPGGDVTAAFASFSRGGTVAAAFAQLLYERGLVDSSTGQVLVEPGKIGISAGVSFDPVGTGVLGNLAFPPNTQNVVVLGAANEYRDFFKMIGTAGHPGLTTFMLAGNHCDLGGGYDNGLGALYLESATAFLQKSGIKIAPVAADRQFDASAAVIHDESIGTKFNDITGEWEPAKVWSTYGSFNVSDWNLALLKNTHCHLA